MRVRWGIVNMLLVAQLAYTGDNRSALTATANGRMVDASHVASVDEFHRASVASSTVGLREDFEHLTTGPWAATSTGAWTGVYTGGELGVEVDGSRVHFQKSRPSKRPGETHADMVVSSHVFDGDIDVQVRIKTVAQLRQGSAPNPWEVAWFGWGYQRAEQFYYFVGKPNGWELGKVDDSRRDPAGPECDWPAYRNCRYRGAQRFLATGNAPTFPVGTWYQLRVVQSGSTIEVFVNGKKLTAFTDDDNVLSRGRLVLYNEDSWARFDDLQVALTSRESMSLDRGR